MGDKLMIILVTGATGYIGREFVRSYCKKYDILTLVRESSNTDALELLNCNIVKFKNYQDIGDIFCQYNIKGVLHFASSVLIEHDINQIDNLLDSNIKYGTYLLEFCKKYDVKWFINTGTFWQNFQNEEYNPVNFYAATKEAFENIAKYYTKTSDLVFTTIKLNDTFGPNKVFNLWAKIAKTGEVLEMSPGEQVIDISYIEDVISAYDKLIENLDSKKIDEFNNKEFIISNNEKMTLKELSKIFEEATNSKLNIVWAGKPYREVILPYNKGEIVPRWEQKYSLKEAIIKTIGENK